MKAAQKETERMIYQTHKNSAAVIPSFLDVKLIKEHTCQSPQMLVCVCACVNDCSVCI